MNTERSTPTFYCQVCGMSFVPQRNFAFDGRVCDRDCQREYEWIKTLMIMGNKYYMDPRRSEAVGGNGNG